MTRSPTLTGDALIETIRDAIIGDDEAVAGPFGLRRVTYADYTASGPQPDVHRGLHPRRGAAAVRQHAHRIVAAPACRRRASARTRGGSSATRSAAADDHAVIFCGSGAPRAIDKLVGVLEPAPPGRPRRPLRPLAHGSRADERPVVFIGPFEHHSNELPWRESIADVVIIHEDADGHIDLAQLEEELVALRRPAAARSAASRPPQRHRHPLATRARSRSCCTATARCRSGTSRPPRPTSTIEMTPRGDGRVDAARPDARLQGRDLPLAAQVHRRPGHARRAGRPRASCSTTACPRVPGGGTVAYVNPAEHVYLADPEHREEGGTPAIVESIRAGLVFQLKEAVGRRGHPRARGVVHPPRHRRLGAHTRTSRSSATGDAERLSIVSFVVRHGGRLPAPQLRRRAAQRPVRHPVARRLLLRRALRPPAARHRPRARRTSSSARSRRGCEGIKPGWVRVNFNYFISRGGLRLHPRGGRAVADRRLEAAAGVPLRRRRPGCGATAAAWPSRR